MKKFILLMAVVLAGLAAGPAHGKVLHANYPLHYGNKAQEVCDLQWLLAGHKPSVYQQSWYRVYKKPIGKTNCYFDKNTANAVVGMKWRLGYRKVALRSYAGKQFQAILVGKIRRPALMQKRALIRRHPPKSCKVANNVVRLARAEIGNHEVPWGSNHGGRVTLYESTTRAYYAPWCASFAQTILKWAHLGPIANSSAGVGYISDYAYRHGWTTNVIRPGELVAWGSTHVGIIDAVTRTGYYTIEGNYADRVSRNFYARGRLGGTLIEVPGLERHVVCRSR